MDAKTDESHGAVAGQVERSVRPAAWWRLSTLPECRPCVTTCAEEAQQWRDEGHDVRELADVSEPLPRLPTPRLLASGMIAGKHIELRGWHTDDLDIWQRQHGRVFRA